MCMCFSCMRFQNIDDQVVAYGMFRFFDSIRYDDYYFVLFKRICISIHSHTVGSTRTAAIRLHDSDTCRVAFTHVSVVAFHSIVYLVFHCAMHCNALHCMLQIATQLNPSLPCRKRRHNRHLHRHPHRPSPSSTPKPANRGFPRIR